MAQAAHTWLGAMASIPSATTATLRVAAALVPALIWVLLGGVSFAGAVSTTVPCALACPGFNYDSPTDVASSSGAQQTLSAVPAVNSERVVARNSSAGLHLYDSGGSFVAPSASPWLRGTAGNAGRVPDSVRAALDGQSFSSRADFRAAFWRAAGDDPALASQFSPSNVTLMQSGRAPIAPSSQHFGGRTRYELHHVTPVSRGGAEFDLDNIVVVTPRYHQDVLSTSYHYGGGG